MECGLVTVAFHPVRPCFDLAVTHEIFQVQWPKCLKSKPARNRGLVQEMLAVPGMRKHLSIQKKCWKQKTVRKSLPALNRFGLEQYVIQPIVATIVQENKNLAPIVRQGQSFQSPRSTNSKTNLQLSWLQRVFLE